MPTLTYPQSAEKVDPSSVRTKHDRPALGYKFDPVPKSVLDLTREGKLARGDDLVLAVLLRFRKRLSYACWCSKATIAEKVGCSARTVQRSLFRLGQAGLIAQEALDEPDPDDPKNRTGWRIVFLWLAPKGYVPKPGPSRTGRQAKCLPQATERGDNRVSPPETTVSPPGETTVSPNYACASKCSDGIESDRRNLPPSSSSEEIDDDDNKQGLMNMIQAEQIEDAWIAVDVCFGKGVSTDFRDRIDDIAPEIQGRWDLYAVAIHDTHGRASKGKKFTNPLWYAISTTKDWLTKRIPTKVQEELDRRKRIREEGERIDAEIRAQAAAGAHLYADKTVEQLLEICEETGRTAKLIGENHDHLGFDVIRGDWERFHPALSMRLRDMEPQIVAYLQAQRAEHHARLEAGYQKMAAANAAKLAAPRAPLPSMAPRLSTEQQKQRLRDQLSQVKDAAKRGVTVGC